MATIFFVIVLLHFIVGFGWLAFKLSPKGGKEEGEKRMKEDDEG